MRMRSSSAGTKGKDARPLLMDNMLINSICYLSVINFFAKVKSLIPI